MAFDVAVHNAQIVHVKVHAGAVQGNFYPHGHRQVQSALHMQHVKQTAVHELVDYHNVRDRRTAAHEERDVRVAQNALHYDLILNLRKKLVRYVWVEDFLYGYGRAIQQSFVDH